MKFLAAATLLVLVLAGCGGGSKTESSTTASPTSSSTSSATSASATASGCTASGLDAMTALSNSSSR